MAFNCIIVANPPSAQPGDTDPSDLDMGTVSLLSKPQTALRWHDEHSDDDFATIRRPAPTATNKRARIEKTKATPTALAPLPLSRMIPRPLPGTQTATRGTQKPPEETEPPPPQST